MNKRAGVSLLEVMFVTAILGLILSMVCHGLVVGYRSHVYTTERSHAYRGATIVLSRMAREIATCNAWQNPPQGVTATPTQASPMRFLRNDASSVTGLTSGVEVRYYLNADSRELYEKTPTGDKVVARNITLFTVEAVSPNVRIRMGVRGVETPLEVEARAPRM